MGYYKYIYYKYIISYCNYTSLQFSHSKNNDSMSTSQWSFSFYSIPLHLRWKGSSQRSHTIHLLSFASHPSFRPWHDTWAIACAWCYHLHKPRKRRLVGAMKNLPLYKAAWADITYAKFSTSRAEFILVDITELILNWFL